MMIEWALLYRIETIPTMYIVIAFGWMRIEMIAIVRALGKSHCRLWNNLQTQTHTHKIGQK